MQWKLQSVIWYCVACGTVVSLCEEFQSDDKYIFTWSSRRRRMDGTTSVTDTSPNNSETSEINVTSRILCRQSWDRLSLDILLLKLKPAIHYYFTWGQKKQALNTKLTLIQKTCWRRVAYFYNQQIRRNISIYLVQVQCLLSFYLHQFLGKISVSLDVKCSTMSTS